MKLPFTKQARQAQNETVVRLSAFKLDLGCGKSKKEGFIGIDRRKFEGVDGVTDLTAKTWIFDKPDLGGIRLLPSAADKGFFIPANSVSEVRCSHFLEHLEHNQRQPERVRFMNELWRVLLPGGVATVITPHWASNRAYGDFTHADKPVTEMFYSYLNKKWRETHAPDNDIEFNPDGYNCDFIFQIGYMLHPDIMQRSQEERDVALQWYKEAILELHVRLVAQKE